MRTLKPSTQAKIFEAVAAFIEKHASRYNFMTIDIPKSERSCGCIWGHAGRILNKRRKNKLDRLWKVAQLFGVTGTEVLYDTMDKETNSEVWKDESSVAASGLRRIAANLRGLGRMRA